MGFSLIEAMFGSEGLIYASGFVKDIRCKNIEINNCKEEIELTMNYPSSTSKPFKALPSFKNFHFDNISISNANLGFKVLA